VDGPAVVVSRLGRPLDHEIVVVGVRRPDGAPVAAVWNFGIHGTMLGASNLALSGDVVGVTSQLVEKALGVPVLFVPGALADVSPARHGAAELPVLGGELAEAVLEGWRGAAPLARTTLITRATTVALPAPYLSLRNCLGRWVPRLLTVPLGDLFPRDATLTAVALGDLAWVVVPGELQTALGRRVKVAGRELFGEAFVAGVSNDYLGYFVTPADYERPSYVTCASVYGPDAGEQLTERAVDLLYGLRGRARPGGRPARSADRVLGRGGETPGERGLLPGGGVAVDHALGHGLVERADRLGDRSTEVGALSGTGRLDGRPDLRADRAVAEPPPLVLAHALHRGLRVRHLDRPSRVRASERARTTR
jgi:hypothetical protein